MFSARSSFFGGFDKSGKSFGDGSTDIIVSVVVKHGDKNLGSLLNIRGESSSALVDEDSKHLNSSILLFDFIGNDVGKLVFSLTFSSTVDFRKNIGNVSKTILTLNSHLRVESGHFEDGGEDIFQVRGKVSLHQKADSLPGAE